MNNLTKKRDMILKLYKGDKKNNVRNGFGIQLFLNGDIYIGSWKKDEFNGNGKLILRSGIEVRGKFEKSNLVEGKILWEKDIFFDGIFLDSKFLCGYFYFNNEIGLRVDWETFPLIEFNFLYRKNDVKIKFNFEDKKISYLENFKEIVKFNEEVFIFKGEYTFLKIKKNGEIYCCKLNENKNGDGNGWKIESPLYYTKFIYDNGFRKGMKEINLKKGYEKKYEFNSSITILEFFLNFRGFYYQNDKRKKNNTKTAGFFYFPEIEIKSKIKNIGNIKNIDNFELRNLYLKTKKDKFQNIDIFKSLTQCNYFLEELIDFEKLFLKLIKNKRIDEFIKITFEEEFPNYKKLLSFYFKESWNNLSFDSFHTNRNSGSKYSFLERKNFSFKKNGFENPKNSFCLEKGNSFKNICLKTENKFSCNNEIKNSADENENCFDNQNEKKKISNRESDKFNYNNEIKNSTDGNENFFNYQNKNKKISNGNSDDRQQKTISEIDNFVYYENKNINNDKVEIIDFIDEEINNIEKKNKNLLKKNKEKNFKTNEEKKDKIVIEIIDNKKDLQNIKKNKFDNNSNKKKITNNNITKNDSKKEKSVKKNLSEKKINKNSNKKHLVKEKEILHPSSKHEENTNNLIKQKEILKKLNKHEEDKKYLIKEKKIEEDFLDDKLRPELFDLNTDLNTVSSSTLQKPRLNSSRKSINRIEEKVKEKIKEKIKEKKNYKISFMNLILKNYSIKIVKKENIFFEGIIIKNKKIGYCKIKNNLKDVKEGVFKNNKKNGIFFLKKEKVNFAIGKYEDNKKKGIFTEIENKKKRYYNLENKKKTEILIKKLFKTEMRIMNPKVNINKINLQFKNFEVICYIKNNCIIDYQNKACLYNKINKEKVFGTLYKRKNGEYFFNTRENCKIYTINLIKNSLQVFSE